MASWDLSEAVISKIAHLNFESRCWCIFLHRPMNHRHTVRSRVSWMVHVWDPNLQFVIDIQQTMNVYNECRDRDLVSMKRQCCKLKLWILNFESHEDKLQTCFLPYSFSIKKTFRHSLSMYKKNLKNHRITSFNRSIFVSKHFFRCDIHSLSKFPR